jgi:hypothetical protein
MPKRARRIAVLVTLAVCAYLPALQLPFIADDYSQIPRATQYSAQGWVPLWHDLNLRTRATYVFLSAVLGRAFGFTPLPFYAASLLLHSLCVLMVYATCVWSEVSEPLAFWAACFFAVYEGHQEAVMWLAASSDLLVFLFGMAAWVCWVRWIQSRSWKWYGLALASFLAATASKESAWIFPLLMLMPLLVTRQRLRFALTALLPFFAITATFVAWNWGSRVGDVGYQDSRFSLSAPWALVALSSFWRLFFVWGFIALAVILWIGKRRDAWVVSLGSLWAILSLLPYSFLTYMPYVPSRHTYIASAGLSWIVGAAAVRLSEYKSRVPLIGLCLAALTINLEILWVKKMSQFRERAEPSELLKQAAKDAKGPLYIDCWPLPDFLAQDVLAGSGSRAIFRGPGAQSRSNCFSVEYMNREGQLIHEFRRLGSQRHGVFY